ncbi:hypothetical protein EV359DRAFT_65873 [Lentinula novae-zelandiae]|nr:hypothetical protein EV359DRAFT_65873 [Lentinula novae-zelandiae]
MPYSFQERELPHTALDMLSPSAPLLPSPFNIILFGSTGCGKSSIVNMLLGHEAALIVTIKRQEYCLYDTTGLDEGTVGTVVSKDALVKLYHLLHDLQGGISLLVYCIQEPTMDSWWTENKYTFNNYGLHFVDHACITAMLGKKMKNGEFRNQEEYNESKETKTWLVSVMKWHHRNLPSWLGDHVTPRLTDLYEVLKSFLPEQDARDIVNQADMKPVSSDALPLNRKRPDKKKVAPTPVAANKAFAFA